MNTTIRDLMAGVTTGKTQTVGNMSVIPLISDIIDNRFISPTSFEVGTEGYGTMVVKNTSGDFGILPMGAGYIVKDAAQNHASCGAEVIKGKSTVKITDAACIQQSQGGYIQMKQHQMTVLPMLLKEPAINTIGERNYGKLWPSIAAFNKSFGLTGRGHLEDFLNKFKDQLDEFIAEFELVKDQVGAIVMINGEVVGIERAPNYEYWRDLWKPLVRDCYGSASMWAAKNDTKNSTKGRVPLSPLKRKDIDGVIEALASTEDKEDRLIRDKVREIVPIAVEVSEGEKKSGIGVDTFSGDHLRGQYIKDGAAVVYLSAFVTASWMKNPKKRKAVSEFNI